jgi:membrane associated rhomboid family serine protease
MAEIDHRLIGGCVAISLTVRNGSLRNFPKISRIARPLPAFLPRASVGSMRQGATRTTTAFPWSVWVLAILCAIPELALLGADWGLWGSARWRPFAYTQGAFWAGLLYGWTPNYALQPVLMFFSHAWLHAGPGHLAGNLAALLWLGPQVVARRGNVGLLVFWCVSVLGGGAAFGLLTSSPAPMVGASGALFGLAAEWVVAEVRGLGPGSGRLLRGLGLVTLVLLLNAAVWLLQGGQLAWETHLGGFAVGLVLAVLWRGRADPGEDPVIGGQKRRG